MLLLNVVCAIELCSHKWIQANFFSDCTTSLGEFMIMAASHWDVFLKKKRTHEASPDDDGPSTKRWQVEAGQPVSSYQIKKKTRELFPNLSRITTPTGERDTPVKKKVQGSPIKIRDIVEKYRKHKTNFTNSSTRLSALNKGKTALYGAGSSNDCVGTVAGASNIEHATNELKSASHIAGDLGNSIQHSPMLSKNCDAGSKVKHNLLELVPEPDGVRSDKIHARGKSESNKNFAESNNIKISGRGYFQETSNPSQIENCKNAILVTEKFQGNEVMDSKVKLNLTLDVGIKLKKKIPASDPVVPELRQDESGTRIVKTICSAGHVTDITEMKYAHREKESNNNLLLGITEMESLITKEGMNKSDKRELQSKIVHARDAQVGKGLSAENFSLECLSEKPVAFQEKIEKDSKANTSLDAVGSKTLDAMIESKCNSISKDTTLQSSVCKPLLKGLLPDTGFLLSNANVDGSCDKNDRSFEQRLLQVKEKQLTKWKSCFLDNNKADKNKKTENNTCVQSVKGICSELSRTGSTDGSKTDHEEAASCILDHLQVKTCHKPGTQTYSSAECSRSPGLIVSVNEVDEDEDEEGEVLNLSDQEVEVKEEVIDDAAFVNKMNLDEVTVQTILSKYSDILPDAIRYLTQYSSGQVPQSTKAVTITPVSKKLDKERYQPKETCLPYEVEIVTSTNSFSIAPIIVPKVEFKSEPVESRHSDSCSSSAPSSAALLGDVVVSDREEFSDESSDDPDTDATRHLQLVRSTKHNIGLTKYKPAVIKRASSGVVVPPGEVLKRQSSFHMNFRKLRDNKLFAHKISDGTISSNVDVGSSLRASSPLGLKAFSAVKSNLTEPMLASNFYVTNKLGMVHKLKDYTTIGQPLEEVATALSTSNNALGNCPPSVNMKSLTLSSSIDTDSQPEQIRISCQNLPAIGLKYSNTVRAERPQTNSTLFGVLHPLPEHAGPTSPIASSQKSIHLNVPIYSPRFRTISAHPGFVDHMLVPSIKPSNCDKGTKPCTVAATSAASLPSSIDDVCCQASSVIQNTSPQDTVAMQQHSILLPDSNILTPNIVKPTSNQSVLITSHAPYTIVQSGSSTISAAPVRLLGLSNIPKTEADLLLPTSFSNVLLSPAVSCSINIPRTQQSFTFPTFPNLLLNPAMTSTQNTPHTKPSTTFTSFSNTLHNPAVTVSVNSHKIQPNLLLATSFSNSLLGSTTSGSPNIPPTQSCIAAKTSLPTLSQSCLSSNSPTIDKNSQPHTQASTGGLSTPLAAGMAHTFLFQPASMPGCPKPPLLLIKANSLEDVQNLLKHKKIVIRPNAQPSISFEGLPPTSPDGALSSAPSLAEQSPVTTITTSSASSDSMTNTVPSNVVSGCNGPIVLSSTNDVSSVSTTSNNNNNIINLSVVKTYSKKASEGGKVPSKPLHMNKVPEHTGSFTKAYDVFPTVKKCNVILKPCDIISLDEGETTVNLNSYFRKLANVSSINLKSSSKKTYAKCTSRGYSVKHSGILGKTGLLIQEHSISNPTIDMSPPSSSQTSAPHKSSSPLSSLNSMLTNNNTHRVPSLSKGLITSAAGENHSSSFVVPSNMDHTITHQLECKKYSLESKSNALVSKNDLLESNVTPLESNANTFETNDNAFVSNDDPIVSWSGTVDCIDSVDSSTFSNTKNCSSKPTETYQQACTAEQVSRLEKFEANPLSIVKTEPVADSPSAATPTIACQSYPSSVLTNSICEIGGSSQFFVVLNQSHGSSNTSSSVSNIPSCVSITPSGVSITPSGVSSTPYVVSSTPSGVSSTSSGVNNMTSCIISTPSAINSTPTLVCSCGPLCSCDTCHEPKRAEKLSPPPLEGNSCSTPGITENEISLILQSADSNSSMQASK